MSREEVYYALMQGVGQLDFNGPAIPSDLALIGDNTIPLAMNPRGQVLMAASTYGKGRLVALGHESMLTTFPVMVENALKWLNPTAESTVGIHESCKATLANISSSGTRAEVTAFRKELGAYIITAYDVGPHVKELVAFLKAGGGLLVAGQAWNWAKEHPKDNALLGFPGNKVCSVAGIYFTELMGERGVCNVPPRIPASWLGVAIDKDFEDDMEFLLQGVSEFDIQGGAVPSVILVHGPLAFPIAADGAGKVFFAGSYYGQGRVIVTTHESYLGRKELAPFLLNAIRWLDEGRGGEVGVLPKLSGAHTLLSESGLTCTKTGFRDDLSVYVCTAYSDAQAAEIQDFVAEGGGLLMGGHSWNWAHKNKGLNVMTHFPGNRILTKLGFSIMPSYAGRGKHKAREPGQGCAEEYRFRRALRQFASHVTSGQELRPHEQSSLRRLGTDCADYLRMQAHDQGSYTAILELLANVFTTADMPQVCSECPVKHPKDHMLLNLGTEVYKAFPYRDQLLPYLIKNRPDLPVVHNTCVKINTKAAGGDEWKSTGLYLSPGMKTYLSIPPQIVNKGWKVQIGCQTDNIGKADVLRRAAVVYERFDIKSEMIEVFNLWGGLIYLVAPAKSDEGELQIIVQKAIPAPYYKSGETSVEAWVGGIRDAPAPWAEMEFENIIITLPSSEVRAVDRPDEVAKMWDSIMGAVSDLAGTPAQFPRKERYVGDVQISHGWMHAGYPVMMHSSSAAGLLKHKDARENGIWGAIHELGHNQQRGCWEFPPNTTECTCNLWSVYVHEKVFGLERESMHSALLSGNRSKRRETFQKEKDLSKWTVWTALETYLQLQEKFGWDAFKKVFAVYHTMTGVPKDRDAKMSLYAETFSRTVNMNLAPFFKAWAWPILPDTEKKLEDLPAWSDHPMT
ncbi:hypothetical protein COCON_G00187030 [Conger conger]|uniref:Peptidase M60 domain-containing protein n=1 Tax=Conger conger TaxID=82655 RepID=A0A9Q1D2D3_CONCO|nr:TRPM8 channel-associated factor homolog isoform X1 [Conger conger]XP_061073808.1 TRPM8 channel-associated factor homolog isoform X1 [Conger conger]XP_061073809.1 TRPM8 channel-associated factor homolog isoform X1 [Conger conger]XP_061073810.1 TRPM8 channel-associated factor homolog isoform X2 [Conger conger]KAJ8256551.1 hypothetical protein COCON_G00187030 [Conger conger]